MNHRAVLPPSTAIVAPVMKDALSDERNTIVWAISSGFPDAFERHSRDQTGLPFVTAGESLQHASFDRTRGDCIDSDAERRSLECRRLRQPLDRVLAGHVN